MALELDAKMCALIRMISYSEFSLGKGYHFSTDVYLKLYVRYDIVHMEQCLPSIEALCIILINMYLEAERVPSLLTLLVCHLDVNIFTII